MPNELTIMGRTCAHCSRTIEKPFSGVEGVERAGVNYLGKVAAVQGDAETGVLVQALENAGYRAAPKEPNNA